MVSLVQGALKDRGIDDEILAAGQFFRLPRSEVEVKVRTRVNVRVIGLIDTA